MLSTALTHSSCGGTNERPILVGHPALNAQVKGLALVGVFQDVGAGQLDGPIQVTFNS